jgi:hypothetical protein
VTWPLRRPRVPAACQGLDVKAVEGAITESRGDLCAAARALGLHVTDLRLFVVAKGLTEPFDRALDQAMAALFDGLEHPNPRKRIKAAGAVLRFAQARRRGFARG